MGNTSLLDAQDSNQSLRVLLAEATEQRHLSEDRARALEAQLAEAEMQRDVIHGRRAADPFQTPLLTPMCTLRDVRN